MLLWTCMLIFSTVVVVVVGFGDGCDYEMYKCGAWSDGDVMIGMLSSCFCKVENLYTRQRPEKYICSEFSTASFVRMLAVIYTIETINNSSLLPGVRLGYYICDTCSHASKAIQSVEHMLTLNGTHSTQCELMERPMVKAIIGARYSEVSISVAPFLSLYMVPQISSSSSAESLNDRLRYPTFLRTIPSDIHQTRALAKLMSHFKWDWVGVVYGDDNYGKNALQGFLDETEKENVCTAFIEMLPHYLDHKDIESLVQKVIQTIQSSTAKVVLLILREELVYKIFSEAIKQNISRTWIGSDAWSMSQNIIQMKGINYIGNVIGLSFITGQNPGFREYLQSLTITPGSYNKFIEEYKKMGKQKDFLTNTVTIGQDYTDRLAVLSIAHALTKVLDCNETACQGDLNFPPWKLLNELKLVNFSLDNQTFYFNTSGNFVNGYHLINWAQNVSGEQRYLVVAGKYNLEINQIQIDGPINWYDSNNMIPVSICSNICRPGTAKKLSKPSCCHNCTDCLPGTYSNSTNLANCLPCRQGTWSLKGWTHCEPKKEEFWKWGGLRAIILLVFILVGYLLLFINLIIYIVFRESPVIKQAGGYIYVLTMAGLALSYTSVLIFIGKPSNHLCRARHVVYGLGFSLTVSCILVKALRTFIAFLPRYRQHTIKRFYKPSIIITFGTLIQVLICTLWLIFDSPSVEVIDSNDTMVITLQCKEGSGIGFAFMLSYIALLAFICFVLAFKSRKIPQRFNEAGHIILSMLVYLFVWVFFTPIYIAKILEHFSIQAAAILVSSYGIIICHFAPKWYMALCKKKDEVTMEAYIARACNRPSIVSVLSNCSGDGFLDSKIGLYSTSSQISGNSSDDGVGSFKSNKNLFDSENWCKYQSSIRKRIHRRSI